jgi:hypothetical protein
MDKCSSPFSFNNSAFNQNLFLVCHPLYSGVLFKAMEELEIVKQRLVDATIFNHELTVEGKFRLAERQIDTINEIIDQIKSGKVDKIILEHLCDHENMHVKHVAAMSMLRMHYMTDRALEALTSVANSDVPVIGLVASWQIKSWKETGAIDSPDKGKKLKVPKKKSRKNNLPTFEPAIAKYEELNEKQRVAFLAKIYDGEVNNGGHYQFFINQGIEHVQETINSLKIIGARKQSKILEEAFSQYLSHERHHPKTVEDFVAEERMGEFSKLDHSFYDVKTEIHELVEEYLEKNDL